MSTCKRVRYYVVRLGQWPEQGNYVTSFDGDVMRATSKQRDAYRWRDRDLADFIAVRVGDARTVCVRQKRRAT